MRKYIREWFIRELPEFIKWLRNYARMLEM